MLPSPPNGLVASFLFWHSPPPDWVLLGVWPSLPRKYIICSYKCKLQITRWNDTRISQLQPCRAGDRCLQTMSLKTTFPIQDSFPKYSHVWAVQWILVPVKYNHPWSWWLHEFPAKTREKLKLTHYFALLRVAPLITKLFGIIAYCSCPIAKFYCVTLLWLPNYLDLLSITSVIVKLVWILAHCSCDCQIR